MGGVISILLISTISAMVFVGPRVSKTMGEDYKILKFLSFQGRLKTPIVAIWFQFLISFILILTSKFDEVITYAGFTLNLFTLLAVIGIFVHRYKFPNIERPYKTWGYPIVPIIFGIIVTWISVYLLIFKTTESLWGLVTMALGLIFYFVNQLLLKNKPIKN
jgi:APA family basic amino acid/polyamine antiporter